MSAWIDHKYVGLLSPRLDRFARKSDKLYNFRCPFCGDSQKNKWKARGYIYDVKGKLNFKCHNCGHGTSMGGLLEHIDSFLHQQYKVEKFKEGHSNTVPKATNTLPMDFTPKFKPKTLLDEMMVTVESLPEDHPCKIFCINRMIPVEKYKELYYIDDVQKLEQISDKYKDRIVGSEPRLVIPFYSKDGKLIAVTCRALGDERLRYLTVKIDENVPLIYNLDKIDINRPIFVTEGPIDSMFLENAIAVGGSDLKRVEKAVDGELIFVFDNQPRNKELVNIMNAMTNHKMVIWPKNIEEKDINDMILAGREVSEIIHMNTFSGLSLKLAISQWSKI